MMFVKQDALISSFFISLDMAYGSKSPYILLNETSGGPKANPSTSRSVKVYGAGTVVSSLAYTAMCKLVRC
jgi:hypothetical protein